MKTEDKYTILDILSTLYDHVTYAEEISLGDSKQLPSRDIIGFYEVFINKEGLITNEDNNFLDNNFNFEREYLEFIAGDFDQGEYMDFTELTGMNQKPDMIDEYVKSEYWIYCRVNYEKGNVVSRFRTKFWEYYDVEDRPRIERL